MLILAFVGLGLSACSPPSPDKMPADSHNAEGPAPGDNSVPIPESVRRSLGITFARVEERRLESTRKVPGRFELATDARQDYAAPLAGLVRLSVRQHDRVTTGQLLFTVDSREWRQMQTALATAGSRVYQTSAALLQAEITRQASDMATSVSSGRSRAGERHKESLRMSLSAASAEVEQMADLQKQFGGKAIELNEARTRLAAAQASLREAEEETLDTERDLLRLTTEGGGSFGSTLALDAQVQARRSEWEAAQTEWTVTRSAIASILNVPIPEIDRTVPGPQGSPTPLWLASDHIEVRASHAGIVRNLSAFTGGRVEPESVLLTVVDPERAIYRATILQGDLGTFSESTTARILPPSPAGPSRVPLPARVGVLTGADARHRTADLILFPEATAPWALDGVSADAELILSDTEEAVAAVPVSALTRDGLDTILFRRDPKNPDKALRLKADLGVTAGDWVAVESGLGVGDEVVVGGIQQLKLATQGTKSTTGHFHADGTFHEGSH